MKNEVPISKEQIEEMKNDCEIEVASKLCESEPFWSIYPEWYTISSYTYYLKDYFLIKNPNKENHGHEKYVGIRWDRIHGRKRKILKFAIKKQKRRIQQQYDLWNKYAGEEGILYIHSRMGGANWKCFDGKTKLMNQPWFLDRVDDCYDSTYCDFYAKLKTEDDLWIEL